MCKGLPNFPGSRINRSIKITQVAPYRVSRV
jgi:hypothetical protein